MLDLVRAQAFPRRRRTCSSPGHEVDALWHVARLIVEVDGFTYHGTRGGFERDRGRDAQLQLAGYRVLRITWRRLEHAPEQVVALVATALASSA